MTRARSTNIRSRIDSVWERMILAVVAHDVMPITMTMWYLLPAGGADRGFADANCTIETKCP
jgi:hypothetical protein